MINGQRSVKRNFKKIESFSDTGQRLKNVLLRPVERRVYRGGRESGGRGQGGINFVELSRKNGPTNYFSSMDKKE